MNEPSLTDSQRDEMNKRLTDERASIEISLETARLNAATVSLDQTSVGRLSRMDAMQQQAMASVQRERLTLRRRRIDAALDRLTAGTFGNCCQCGEPLALRRLLADPTALFCTDCQLELDERRAGR